MPMQPCQTGRPGVSRASISGGKRTSVAPSLGNRRLLPARGSRAAQLALSAMLSTVPYSVNSDMMGASISKTGIKRFKRV